jgi:hypothetical protein
MGQHDPQLALITRWFGRASYSRPHPSDENPSAFGPQEETLSRYGVHECGDVNLPISAARNDFLTVENVSNGKR